MKRKHKILKISVILLGMLNQKYNFLHFFFGKLMFLCCTGSSPHLKFTTDWQNIWSQKLIKPKIWPKKIGVGRHSHAPRLGTLAVIFSYLDNNWAILLQEKLPLHSIFERPKEKLDWRNHKWLQRFAFHPYIYILTNTQFVKVWWS